MGKSPFDQKTLYAAEGNVVRQRSAALRARAEVMRRKAKPEVRLAFARK